MRSEKINLDEMATRRAFLHRGLTLVGAAATVPAGIWVARSLRRQPMPADVHRDPRLVGATRFPRKGDDLE